MVKHLCLEIIKQQQIPPLNRELVKAVTSSKKKWESIAKVNPVGGIWWHAARLSVRHFKSEKIWGEEANEFQSRTLSLPPQAKSSFLKSIGAVGYLNTWLPRSIFIYSNNTLLTAGCKSELRYVKHWYRLLSRSCETNIRTYTSWYMRLFHTPEYIFPLNYEALNLKTQFLPGFYFYSRKELESALWSLFEFLSASLSIKLSHTGNMKSKHLWKISMASPCRSLLRSVTSVGIVCYPITATSRFWMCHTICWMVLCQAFLSLLPLPTPPSKISSPLAP